MGFGNLRRHGAAVALHDVEGHIAVSILSRPRRLSMYRSITGPRYPFITVVQVLSYSRNSGRSPKESDIGMREENADRAPPLLFHAGG